MLCSLRVSFASCAVHEQWLVSNFCEIWCQHGMELVVPHVGNDDRGYSAGLLIYSRLTNMSDNVCSAGGSMASSYEG